MIFRLYIRPLLLEHWVISSLIKHISPTFEVWMTSVGILMCNLLDRVRSVIYVHVCTVFMYTWWYAQHSYHAVEDALKLFWAFSTSNSNSSVKDSPWNSMSHSLWRNFWRNNKKWRKLSGCVRIVKKAVRIPLLLYQKSFQMLT